MKPSQIILRQDFPKFNGLRQYSIVLWFDDEKTSHDHGRWIVHRMYTDLTCDQGDYCNSFAEAMEHYVERCNAILIHLPRRWEEIQHERLNSNVVVINRPKKV